MSSQWWGGPDGWRDSAVRWFDSLDERQRAYTLRWIARHPLPETWRAGNGQDWVSHVAWAYTEMNRPVWWLVRGILHVIFG